MSPFSGRISLKEFSLAQVFIKSLEMVRQILTQTQSWKLFFWSKSFHKTYLSHQKQQQRSSLPIFVRKSIPTFPEFKLNTQLRTYRSQFVHFSPEYHQQDGKKLTRRDTERCVIIYDLTRLAKRAKWEK
jgi:hypothetical protein